MVNMGSAEDDQWLKSAEQLHPNSDHRNLAASDHTRGKSEKCCCNHSIKKRQKQRRSVVTADSSSRKCLFGMKYFAMLLAFFGLASALAYVILKTRLLEHRIVKLEQHEAATITTTDSSHTVYSNVLRSPDLAQLKELISQEIKKVSLPLLHTPHIFQGVMICTVSMQVRRVKSPRVK